MNPSPVATAATSRRIRTIVADDSPEFLRTFCSYLEAQDNLEIVGRAKNGSEALQLAETLQPDLAILDLEMPVMDGTRAAEKLREKFPAMRLIIVSVHDGPAWREMSRAAGVDAFVPKHEITTELLGHIRNHFVTAELPAPPPFITIGVAATHNLITVLLVEPHTHQADLILHELTRPHIAGHTKAHFEVEHVATLAAAQERLQQSPVDAILIGVQQADPQSLQNITTLRQAAPQSALIAIPHSAEEHIRIAASALGADECLNLQHAELLPLQLRFLVGGRRAEQSLAEREQDFRMLIENALDITCIMDGKFSIRYISPSARQVLGFSPEELRGRPYLSLLHSDDVAHAQKILTEAAAHPLQTMTIEVRFHHHAGHWVHLEMTGRNLPNSAGQPRLVFNARDHTTRIHAEEALRQSEQRFRALFENSPDAIFVEDITGRVLDVNTAACWLHGVPREKIIGQFVWDLVPPAARNQTRLDFPGLVSGKITKLESVSLTADGRAVPVELTTNRILYTGQPAILLNARDITERKKAEAALRASENRFRLMFERTADALLILDPTNNRFIEYNQATADMLRYPDKHELHSLHPAELSPAFQPDGQPSFDKARDMIATALQNGSHRFEWIHCSPHRTDFPVEVLLTPILLGEQQLIITTWRDITERKHVETALRESEIRLRQIAENIEEVFWLGDAEHQRMIYVSPAYEKIWGESLLTLLDNPAAWLKAIHPEDRERITAAWETTLQTGHLDQTYRIVRPDGSIRWIRDQAFPVRDETGKIYRLAGVASDITERRELEEQMRQMQKLDSLGRITASIAHDFNNMLAVIQGHTDKLLIEEQLPPATAKSLGQIAEASRRAAKLTRQLLTFSRKQEMRFQTIDLNHIVTSLAQMLQHVLGGKTTLTCHTLDHPAIILADAGMMEQVLMNLTVNARDAMPKGGQVHITITTVEVDTTFMRRESEATHGPHLCLTVADNGTGIAPEILPRIFEPFFTTKGAGSGTGLGLATVYGIVKQHGGWVEVTSEPGSGSKFKIHLPAAAAETISHTNESAAPITPAPETTPAPQSTTVMVVEDEASLLQLHCINLKRRGYHVLSAESGPRALQVAAENPGAIDLLITDMSLPGGMNGRAVAQVLQAKHPRLKVIITSGNYEHMEENPPSGIQFLAKPFDFKQLGLLVSKMLDKE